MSTTENTFKEPAHTLREINKHQVMFAGKMIKTAGIVDSISIIGKNKEIWMTLRDGNTPKGVSLAVVRLLREDTTQERFENATSVEPGRIVLISKGKLKDIVSIQQTPEITTNNFTILKLNYDATDSVTTKMAFVQFFRRLGLDNIHNPTLN